MVQYAYKKLGFCLLMELPFKMLTKEAKLCLMCFVSLLVPQKNYFISLKKITSFTSYDIYLNV